MTENASVYTIVFTNLTKEEVLALEDALIREQRRRAYSGERSWVIETLLSTMWAQIRDQWPPEYPEQETEPEPEEEPEPPEA